MAGKKKSASDSLAKLSRGLTRETPATRTRTETPEGEGREASAPGPPGAAAVAAKPETREAPRRRGRPRSRTERMVRVSVDLPRPDHKYLRDFAYDAESDGMSVMRALLEEMRDDEDLAERVLDRLGWGARRGG